MNIAQAEKIVKKEAKKEFKKFNANEFTTKTIKYGDGSFQIEYLTNDFMESKGILFVWHDKRKYLAKVKKGYYILKYIKEYKK